MPLPRDLSWLPGESSAAGEGQVSYPAFVNQWNWAKIHRERSCLDPSQEATFWKLFSEWLSGAISQGAEACQREKQILLLGHLFTILKYVTSLGKLFFDWNATWLFYCWGRFPVCLAAVLSKPFCDCKVWRRKQSRPTHYASSPGLLMFFPPRQGKLQSLKPSSSEGHAEVLLPSEIPHSTLSSILYFTGIKYLFLSEMTSLIQK